jgi:hypothetical protein
MSSCHKHIYPSRKAAKQAMKAINRKKRKGIDKRMMNQYWCDDCSGWHLTGMTQERYDRVQKINSQLKYKPK